MFLILLLASVASAEPCAVSGEAELTRGGKKTNEAAGRVVVYVEKVSANAVRAQSKKHSILQVGLNFEPKVLVVQAGDSVEFYNRDLDLHSVFSNSKENTFEFTESRRGRTGEQPFLHTGPVRIQCNLHKKMRADVLVLQNPYYSIVKPDGSWRIAGLREGEHQLVVWEPNGATIAQRVKSCSGEIQVGLLTIEEAAPPKLLSKNGGVRPDYGDRSD